MDEIGTIKKKTKISKMQTSTSINVPPLKSLVSMIKNDTTGKSSPARRDVRRHTSFAIKGSFQMLKEKKLKEHTDAKA